MTSESRYGISTPPDYMCRDINEIISDIDSIVEYQKQCQKYVNSQGIEEQSLEKILDNIIDFINCIEVHSSNLENKMEDLRYQIENYGIGLKNGKI